MNVPSFSLVKAAFYCSVACFLAMMVLRITIVQSVSTDLAGMEQNVVYAVQKLLDGDKLYSSPASLPFSITQYTPLYYYLCGYTAKVAGLDPLLDIHGIYIAGRAWSVIFNILLVVAVFMTARKLGLGLHVSAIAALGSFILLFRHDFSIRSDSLHDALVIWSFYFFISHLQGGHRGRISIYSIAAVILAFLGAFSKQSGIQAPLILLAFLAFTGDFKGLFRNGVLVVVAGGCLTLFFYLIYGDLFFANVIGGIANGVKVEWFIKYILTGSFFIKIFPMIMAVVFLSLYKGFIFKNTLDSRFLAFSALGAFFFATVTALKMGSSIQYYTVFQTLAVVFIFYYFFRKDFDWVHLKGMTRNAVLVAFSFLFLLNVYMQFRKNIPLEYRNRDAIESQNSTALQVVSFLNGQLQPGEYVFANLGVERYGITNALFRNCAVPQLDIFQASTIPLAIFDYDYFEQCMSDGTIRYVIESDPPHPYIISDRYKQLRDNYRLVRVIDRYSIFEYQR